MGREELCSGLVLGDEARAEVRDVRIGHFVLVFADGLRRMWRDRVEAPEKNSLVGLSRIVGSRDSTLQGCEIWRKAFSLPLVVC